MKKISIKSYKESVTLNIQISGVWSDELSNFPTKEEAKINCICFAKKFVCRYPKIDNSALNDELRGNFCEIENKNLPNLQRVEGGMGTTLGRQLRYMEDWQIPFPRQKSIIKLKLSPPRDGTQSWNTTLIDDLINAIEIIADREQVGIVKTSLTKF